MKGDAPISGIYQMGEAPRMTPAEKARQTFELRRAAWRSMGLVVIDPADDDVGEWLREAVMAYARKRFGGLR